MPTSIALPIRCMPIGAEFLPKSNATHFRVWAPERKAVQVVFEDKRPPVGLASEGNGYFSGLAPDVEAGATYKYALGDPDPYPDPVSRFQPAGPHHFSRVVDPASFAWTDENWQGCELKG